MNLARTHVFPITKPENLFELFFQHTLGSVSRTEMEDFSLGALHVALGLGGILEKGAV